MSLFKLRSKFSPTGDQPKAINSLVEGLGKKYKEQTLLGVTGSGKTFTMANIIEKVQRPVLIMSHNKTLAAQLYSEFKQFFPDNAVHYFVSYYDYYQPEAYIPHTDTYIEKETNINEEIDRLRHSTTQSLINRRDVIVIASVSCIYGIGEKENYEKMSAKIRTFQEIKRNDILRKLIKIQYSRNDQEFKRGQFRVVGENIDIHLATGEAVVRISSFGDKVEKIRVFTINPMDKIPVWATDLRKKEAVELDEILILPAKHFITPEENIQSAIISIKKELITRVKQLRKAGKDLEAYKIEKKTKYDLEMIKEIGYCNGIENYSRHFSGKASGEPPETLIDFFPSDFLMFVDESHVTLPQVRGMHGGDASRKQNLIDFGFRLPSARDNRPLKFEEFYKKIKQVIYTSATPGDFEINNSQNIAEQIIRPTGLLDPKVEVRKTKGQLEDLIKEVKKRAKKNERILITTLTKRMSEELTEYLKEQGVRAEYLHSEIDTLDRIDILTSLRKGEFDCLVGINLLREGLDLPEVSLVIILDADMSGFLRNETSLMQIMGRAARHNDGNVLMYADKITPAMRYAISETERRRKLQIKYNKSHGITPKKIKAEFHDKIV